MMTTTPRRNLPGIQLVVFDLDGTIADTKRDLALSVNAMREYMGLGPLPLEAVASYVGHGVTVLIKRALGDKAPDGAVEKGLAFFLDYYSTTCSITRSRTRECVKRWRISGIENWPS